MNIVKKIIESWHDEKGCVNTTEDLLNWIKELNETTYVSISECSINDSTMWFFDDYNGEVLNRKRSFFSIKGIRYFVNGDFIHEQPIIIQPEIGYLGIICKEIEGKLHFLMQAKIEPGNVNCVQISPTIQATKSNFMRAHGGALPEYFEYFENSAKYNVIYDQIQSEQSARFYKKRNRNMIMIVNDEIEVHRNFRWMTLGQIKKLMDIDNLVNMDSRTVLSGLPFILEKLTDAELEEVRDQFTDKALFNSLFMSSPSETISCIFQKLNDYKMFQEVTTAFVPLNQLVDWKIDAMGIICKQQADFMVRYYDIEISGREVRKWIQPLFKAIGMATYGLITKIKDDKRYFLVRAKAEIGSFDKIELGPSVSWEPSYYLYYDNKVDQIFRNHIEEGKGIICNVVLSEEGGRFYHEQNRNVIMEINEDIELPKDYIWADFASLNYLVQVNNYLNIQLRNLLSLLKL